MSQVTARVPLTGGNVRNHHFYLRTCIDLFPQDALGGSSKSAQGAPIEVSFKPGSRVETDIDGAKMFLRDRKSMREFFELAAAEEGDIVLIERTGLRSIEVRLEKGARS